MQTSLERKDTVMGQILATALYSPQAGVPFQYDFVRCYASSDSVLISPKMVKIWRVHCMFSFFLIVTVPWISKHLYKSLTKALLL